MEREELVGVVGLWVVEKYRNVLMGLYWSVQAAQEAAKENGWEMWYPQLYIVHGSQSRQEVTR